MFQTVHRACLPPSICVAASLCGDTVRGSCSCFASAFDIEGAFPELDLRNCSFFKYLIFLDASVVYFIFVFMEFL